MVLTEDEHLSWMPLLVATFQICMWIVTCVRAVVQFHDCSISATLWHRYQIGVYTIVERSTFTGTLLLACKTYVETNLHKSGAPHSFDRLWRYRRPRPPGLLRKTGILDHSRLYGTCSVAYSVYAHVCRSVIWCMCPDIPLLGPLLYFVPCSSLSWSFPCFVPLRIMDRMSSTCGGLVNHGNDDALDCNFDANTRETLAAPMLV